MFSRHYNSGLADHDLGLGPGWRHSYQVFLTRHDATTLHIVQSDGRRIRFERADASVVRYGGRRLQTVTDALGRVLTLHYTPGSIGLGQYDSATNMTQPGHLESLTLPDGSVVMTTIIESITELLEVACGIPR